MPLERPLPVSAGDRLQVQIQAHGNSAQWQWQATAHNRENGTSAGQNGSVHTTGDGQLRSSSLYSAKIKPLRTQNGEIDLFILSLMDGTRPAAAIARQAVDRFPLHMTGIEQALERVSSLAVYYSRWEGSEQRQHTNRQSQRMVSDDVGRDS